MRKIPYRLEVEDQSNDKIATMDHGNIQKIIDKISVEHSRAQEFKKAMVKD